MDVIVPALYCRLGSISTDTTAAEVDATLLTFYATRLVLSIDEIEARHLARPQSLGFLIDTPHSSAPPSPATRLLLQTWFLKTKARYGHGRESPATVLQTSIKQLRLVEYVF